jgi:hypothetical protein
MVLTSKESQTIRKILLNLGFTWPDTGTFVASMQHYEKHHGVNALVKYFAYLKSLVLNDKLIKRKTKSRIFQLLVHHFDSKGRVSVLRILELPGRWKSNEPTKGEFVKFTLSIKDPCEVKPLVDFGFSETDSSTFQDAISTTRVSFKPLLSSSKHVLKDNKTCKGPTDIAEELYALTDAGEIFLRHSDYISSILDISTEGMEILNDMAAKVAVPVVGNIAGLTKDGYNKVRYVANLAKGWQVLISPCVKTYSEFLKVQPESALYDQVSAAKWMAEKLKEGAKVSSIDFKRSTDNIPVYIFWELLDKYIPDEQFWSTREWRLFKMAYYLDQDLCKLGHYRTPYPGVLAFYGRGQAMGRWTSKYMLDMTMLYLARSCGGNGSNCRINGDDIIICDTKVARKFKRLLARLKIPISDEKTYFYKTFGQFSGRIATKEDGILPVFKGHVFELNDDPFGYFRQYGSAGLELVPKKHRKMLQVVAMILGENGGEINLEDFTSSQVRSHLTKGYTPDLGEPLIEKQSWSELWVKQRFAAEFEREAMQMQSQFRKQTRLRRSRGQFSVSQNRMHKSHTVHFAEECYKLRQNTIFKDVAVKRFPEPNSRLNKLLDHLNSRVVISYNGLVEHKITGFGGPRVCSDNPMIEHLNDEIYVRIRKVVDISGSKTSTGSREGSRKLKWIRKIYGSFHKWSKVFLTLTREEKIELGLIRPKRKKLTLTGEIKRGSRTKTKREIKDKQSNA